MKEEKLSFTSLLELPLKSHYRVITFFGAADGAILNQGFDIAALQQRTLVIKSVKLIPYNATIGTIVDFFVTDGVTNNEEILPVESRLPRVIDNFTSGTVIDFLINGVPIGIFPSAGVGGYPIDLHVDNIYYWFKERVETFDISITGFISHARTGALITPNMKVVVEIYLL